MKRADYTLLIKKNAAVLLHLIFLIVAISGISLMYFNTEPGLGLSRLRDRKYEDSPEFMVQFQNDLNALFQYVSYRDAFEHEGVLDLSSQMFSVTRGDGPEIIYTLEEVLRYARSQGFYLNSEFDVVNDLLVYDNAATAKDYRINWRAYITEQQITEPGDAYTSLLELSREVLNCLGAYYKVHYRMIDNPSNLYFRILYEDGPDDQLIYTNTTEETLKKVIQSGRFCYLDSDSAFAETNLPEIPAGITTAMEANNINDVEHYYIIAAVDTSYSADDIYAQNAMGYLQLREHFLEGIIGLALGAMGCLATLYYLILVSGYPNSRSTHPALQGFDTIYTECYLVLAGIFTMFVMFLGEKIGYRILNLLVSKSAMEYSQRMLTAVIIYGCCMIAAFSLLRRHKCRQLWSNSLMAHIYKTIDQYFVYRSFSYRLLCFFLGFVSTQLVGAWLILLGILNWNHPPVRLAVLLLAAALLVLDYQAFHKMFLTALQEDKYRHRTGACLTGTGKKRTPESRPDHECVP